MKMIEIRENGSKRVYTINDDPSLTDPSWADECDTNNIINKFLKTGQVSHLSRTQGSYADLSEIPDLATALSQVTQAQQAFDSLPAVIRKRFGNSPVALVDFLQNEENRDEAIKLGLIDAPPEPSQPSVPNPS